MIIKDWETRETEERESVYLVNRHVYSDRPCYLPKPLIKGLKDRRARTKPLPLNCSRDYRSVLQPRVKYLIPLNGEIRRYRTKSPIRKRSISGFLKYTADYINWKSTDAIDLMKVRIYPRRVQVTNNSENAK